MELNQFADGGLCQWSEPFRATGQNQNHKLFGSPRIHQNRMMYMTNSKNYLKNMFTVNTFIPKGKYKTFCCLIRN